MNSRKEKSIPDLIRTCPHGFQEAGVHTNTQQQTKRQVLLNNYGVEGHKHRLSDEKTNEQSTI